MITEPLFHMNEVSGKMTEIVRKFLKRQPLTYPELDKLRWYIHQWVDAMPTKPPDYKCILHMSQDELMEYSTHTLLDWAIDPF